MRGIWFMFVAAAAVLSAQPESVPLKPPFGPGNALVSPNGAFALIGNYPAPELVVEDQRTHERRHVLTATVQTLSLAWSPDSAAFIVNDRAASDIEYAYLYDLETLDRLDLRGHVVAYITAQDPGAVRFLPGQGEAADHTYFKGARWLDALHVELRMYGHTIGVRKAAGIVPGDCFDLRYRVGRDGKVEKLSQRVAPLTSAECGSLE